VISDGANESEIFLFWNLKWHDSCFSGAILPYSAKIASFLIDFRIFAPNKMNRATLWAIAPEKLRPKPVGGSLVPGVGGMGKGAK
jgi:hypothetical protein